MENKNKHCYTSPILLGCMSKSATKGTLWTNPLDYSGMPSSSTTTGSTAKNAKPIVLDSPITIPPVPRKKPDLDLSPNTNNPNDPMVQRAFDPMSRAVAENVINPLPGNRTYMWAKNPNTKWYSSDGLKNSARQFWMNALATFTGNQHLLGYRPTNYHPLNEINIRQPTVDLRGYFNNPLGNEWNMVMGNDLMNIRQPQQSYGWGEFLNQLLEGVNRGMFEAGQEVTNS